jgi:excinuclease ABC subunit C
MKRFKMISKNKLYMLPKTAGVYCFFKKNKIIYIGKAINIQNRIKNHFQQPSNMDNLYIDDVDKIGYLETNSEIEALILEANLIKNQRPKFNIVWKDDKNYFYVAITQNKQKIPFVYITHQINHKPYQPNPIYIGPFVEGVSLKKTLKFLRRVFPYYTIKKHSENKCTYCHLDLCPGPNPNLVEYKKNIKKLVLILKGKRNAVLNTLKKEMKNFSKEKEFEKAGKTRDRIYNLQRVISHTNVINNVQAGGVSETPPALSKILGMKKNIRRIECYDVSNIQGKHATGSMIVFINGQPEKNQYKKFKIKIKNEPNDIAMLKEIIERRILHKEWPYPEVILIDGGIAQLNIAVKIKNQNKKTKLIKIISLAKKNKLLYIENKKQPILLKSLPREIFNLILQLDAQAHRFAITYHKKLRKKQLLS